MHFNKTHEILKRDGAITHLVAQSYKIGCVRKEISVLRGLGYRIKTERKKDAEGKKYTRWVMMGS